MDELIEERYSARARRSLEIAEEVARRFSQVEVEPEHLLLAMLELGEGVDIEALARLGVDVSTMRAKLEALIPRGKEGGEAVVTLSSRTVEKLHAAVEQARRQTHSYVGKEHFLLSLTLESQGVLAEVFQQFSITYDSVREAVAVTLSGRLPNFRRYNLALSEELFAQIEAVGRRDRISLVEVIRRYVRLGLLVDRTQAAGGSIILRESDREREVLFF